MSQLIAEFTKQAKKGSNRMVDGEKKKKHELPGNTQAAAAPFL